MSKPYLVASFVLATSVFSNPDSVVFASNAGYSDTQIRYALGGITVATIVVGVIAYQTLNPKPTGSNSTAASSKSSGGGGGGGNPSSTTPPPVPKQTPEEEALNNAQAALNRVAAPGKEANVVPASQYQQEPKAEETAGVTRPQPVASDSGGQGSEPLAETPVKAKGKGKGKGKGPPAPPAKAVAAKAKADAQPPAKAVAANDGSERDTAKTQPKASAKAASRLALYEELNKEFAKRGIQQEPQPKAEETAGVTRPQPVASDSRGQGSNLSKAGALVAAKALAIRRSIVALTDASDSDPAPEEATKAQDQGPPAPPSKAVAAKGVSERDTAKTPPKASAKALSKQAFHEELNRAIAKRGIQQEPQPKAEETVGVTRPQPVASDSRGQGSEPLAETPAKAKGGGNGKGPGPATALPKNAHCSSLFAALRQQRANSTPAEDTNSSTSSWES
jgi:hypothetical protein